MEEYLIDPNKIEIGQRVPIETSNGVTVIDLVEEILSKGINFLGVKVRGNGGTIGRVKHTQGLESSGDALKKFLQELDYDESLTLEFKGSLLFDFDKFKEIGKDASGYKIPHSVAKTVAAFANADGGTLYIGIQDKTKEILGLENDYNILKKQKGATLKDGQDHEIKIPDTEEFLTALKTLMEQFLGKHDYMGNTRVEILKVDNKQVCAINVTPSTHPIILKRKNTKENLEFYVRHGDQSEQYDYLPRFIHDWCERRHRSSS